MRVSGQATFIWIEEKAKKDYLSQGILFRHLSLKFLLQKVQPLYDVFSSFYKIQT